MPYLAKTFRNKRTLNSYGMGIIVDVKGKEPRQPALNQLAGEAHKTARLLAGLK